MTMRGLSTGAVMSHPFLDRFLRAVEADYGAVFAGPDADGHRLLVEFAGDRYDPPLVVDFGEEEFEAAVRRLEKSGHSVWPEVPPVEGAIRLMTVHLEESLLSTRPVSQRVYIAEGQIWAE
jgi:hypothetical protein